MAVDHVINSLPIHTSWACSRGRGVAADDAIRALACPASFEDERPAMSFPPSFLDELRSRLPVSEVVGRKVKLTRRGREFVGLSPFNPEKTPSFTVNDHKGFYHD